MLCGPHRTSNTRGPSQQEDGTGVADTWTALFIDPGVTKSGKVTLTTRRQRSVSREEEGKECRAGMCEETSNRLEVDVNISAVENSFVEVS